MREATIWAVALIVSLSLHLALFWHDPVQLSADDGTAKRQAGVTRLSFRVTPRPQLPTPTPEVRPERQPQPPRKAPPVPQEVAKVLEKARTPLAETQPLPPSEPVAAAAVDSAGDPLEQERARQHYLGQLLSHIEEHKFYPRAARRRGMQGVIQVSFQLQSDGSITGLRVEEGHELLRTAAAEAVQASLPLPPPPPQIHCPMTVRYGMEFKLN